MYVHRQVTTLGISSGIPWGDSEKPHEPQPRELSYSGCRGGGLLYIDSCLSLVEAYFKVWGSGGGGGNSLVPPRLPEALRLRAASTQTTARPHMPVTVKSSLE